MLAEESLERSEMGAPQGAPTDGAPQPPAPNTKRGLSAPALLPPSRESEIDEGWSSAGAESKEKKGQAVGKERVVKSREKNGGKDAKKGGSGESQGCRAGVTRGEPSAGGRPVTTWRHQVTVRDLRGLRRAGRHVV